MNNFRFHAPTEILFGKGEIRKLPEILRPYGKNILLAYGGGSIKTNGIYDAVKALLTDFNVFDFAGIEPNPRLNSVEIGAALCREHQIDVILAVGGGSVIDCSKVVSAAALYEGKAWDLVEDPSKITKALPVVTVLTLAGTGSEMNKGAVITNETTHVKRGAHSNHMVPKTSIVDPSYLMTLPAKQTAAGSADIMSHILEVYFMSTPDTYVQDRVSEGLLKTVIHYAPIALKDPQDYAARANLAWASSLALNGICGSGKGNSWTIHPIEHELSAYYDLTHGIGLALLTPVWMRKALNDATVEKFCAFARNVFDLPDNPDRFALAHAGIDALEAFFKGLGIPMHLSEVGIDDAKFELMAKSAVKLGRLDKAYVPLDEAGVIDILKACL